MGILIVLGGAVVRITGSGLGCPTWPACNATQAIAPISDDIHQVIEQTNRLITGVLIVAVGWAIIAIRLQRPWNRTLGRLSWSMFWLVVVNAVAGGITVLLELNPWVVALHFVLAMALLASTTITWHRARWPGDADAVVAPGSRALGWTLLTAAGALVVAGTIVTGAGPHSGDPVDPHHLVPRNGFDWTSLVWLHGMLAAIVVVLVVVIAVRVPSARRRAIVLVVVLLLQGAVGVTQSLTALPGPLVVVHVLGAALVWVGAIRVLLDIEPGLFALRAVPESSAAAAPRL